MTTFSPDAQIIGNRYAARPEVSADSVVSAQVVGEGVLRVFPSNFYDQDAPGSIPDVRTSDVAPAPVDEQISA